MTHGSRKILVTVSATTNYNKTKKTYPSQTYKYPYPADSAAQTAKARADGGRTYKAWLKAQVADVREMLHLSLNESHRIQYD